MTPYWDLPARAWWKFMHHKSVIFQGLSCLQNPVDMFMLVELAHGAQADTIIELGTYEGGTACFLQAALGCDVFTIDQRPIDLNRDRIECIAGNIIDPKINEHLVHAVSDKERRILVIDDASHEYGQVLRALELYAPLVSVGSCYVVMDTIVDTDILEEKSLRPSWAVGEFLMNHPDFEAEESPYALSNAIKSILRRKA